MNRSVWIAIVVLVLLGIGAFVIISRQSSTTQTAATPVPTEAAMASGSPLPPSTDNGSSSSAMAGEGTTKEITVEGSPFKFVPATISVNQGDKVKVTFKNLAGTHDFVIDELNVKTPVIQAGKDATVEFTADKKGTFKYYCSVGNHRAMGMEGTLTVK